MVFPVVLAVGALVLYVLSKPKSKNDKSNDELNPNIKHTAKCTQCDNTWEETDTAHEFCSQKCKNKSKENKKDSSNDDIEKMTEKDLVKKIKNGSKEWQKWEKNESNEKYYEEIERRNRLIELPKTTKVGKVFRDDPNAISMMKTKVENKEKMVLYWKSIIKFPARTYGRALGDTKWYALTGASTEVREAKKKLEKLESDKKAGKTLERKSTFTTGKKRFYYKESS